MDIYKIDLKYGQVEYYFEGRCLRIKYELPIDGYQFVRHFTITLQVIELHLSEPLTVLKKEFYQSSKIPEVKQQSEENEQSIKEFESFIDDHGQEIIDKAVSIGWITG